MFRGGVTSWNLRDRHMADTLDALVDHLERTRGAPPKVVVWAHNSHLGDARATEIGQAGELNVGQLVRERHGRDAALIVGFTTYTGTVTAALGLGRRRRSASACAPRSPAATRRCSTSRPPRFLLRAASTTRPRRAAEPRLERAIGVIYRPETERMSHYFHARLADQFDAVIHLDETRALEPLDRTAEWETGEVPETYPWGV